MRSLYDLDFTEDDLAANRSGELSGTQRVRIAAILKMNSGGLRWIALWVYGLIVVGFVLELSQSREPFFDALAKTSQPILIAVGILTTILLGSWLAQQINQRGLVKGTIRIAEGTAKVWEKSYSVRGGHSTNYLLTIQGRRRITFTFSDRSSQRYFQNGQMYRVYYIPYYPLSIALSAERNEA